MAKRKINFKNVQITIGGKKIKGFINSVKIYYFKDFKNALQRLKERYVKGK